MPTPHTPLVSPALPRVTGAYAQPLLEEVAQCGIALADLARAAGCHPGLLQPLPDSLAAADYVRLLDAGARLSGHPHFGLRVGQRVRPGTYSVYGLILLSCRDLGQAFEQTLRYEGLAHDLGRSELRVVQGVAEYRWHSHFPDASAHLAESVFAGVRVFGDWLTGRRLPALEVAFAHAAPADTQAHRNLFGCEVAFGAPWHCARFDASLLALPVPHADPAMVPVLQQHAEGLLRQREQGAMDIVAQVQASIERNLAQDRATLAVVAQELGLTVRTLQRKLALAQSGFQTLLDTVRKQMAHNYLRQPDLGLIDIAFLLGFQDQSAFNHAFKEWTGHSPGAYRERLRS